MIKIIVVAILCAIIIIYLKSINSELSFIAHIGAGIILLSFSLEYIENIYSFVNKIVEMTGIDKSLYKIILKIIAIGYIVEFGGQTLSDFGQESLAKKIYFIGKLAIFSVSIPIIYAIFNLLIGLLQ